MLPEAFVNRVGECEVAQQAHRFTLPFGDDAVADRGFVLCQMVQGLVVEIGQQLAFPLVPDLRAGAADIGVGEQVKSYNFV